MSNISPKQPKQNTKISLSLEQIIDKKKMELEEQTKKIDKINNTNRETIIELQNKLKETSTVLTNICNIENSITKIIETHKRKVDNPDKSKEEIKALEKEIKQIEDDTKTVFDRCLKNMDNYREYLESFL